MFFFVTNFPLEEQTANKFFRKLTETFKKNVFHIKNSLPKKSLCLYDIIFTRVK